MSDKELKSAVKVVEATVKIYSDSMREYSAGQRDLSDKIAGLTNVMTEQKIREDIHADKLDSIAATLSDIKPTVLRAKTAHERIDRVKTSVFSTTSKFIAAATVTVIVCWGEKISNLFAKIPWS